MKYPILLLLLLLIGCDEPHKPADAPTDNKKEFSQTTNYVDTIHLRLGSFKSQLLSNGKLRAQQKSDLQLMGSGAVRQLGVSNGSTVAQGAVIAALDNAEQQLQLTQAQERLERAKIDLQDALLGFGYTTTDTTQVKAEHLRIAKLRSGYDESQTQIRAAKMAIERSILRAPFSGKIANLKTKLHENPRGDFFCTLINDRSFDVEFSVLEGELPNVRVGQSVLVSTFNDPLKRYQGTIKNLNPMIDERGQVTVTANIPNPGPLVDGMNVKVFIENSVIGKLVVPKSAVLIRDNLEVLFRINPQGKTIWTYVHIQAANSDSYSVVANTDRGADLQAGDVVITGGNLNLADNVAVEVRR